MSAFKSIKGIGTASQTLLEASGVRDVDTLARADIDDLTRLLAQRNQELTILKRPPRRAEVDKWVRAARGETIPPAHQAVPSPSSAPTAATNGSEHPWPAHSEPEPAAAHELPLFTPPAESTGDEDSASDETDHRGIGTDSAPLDPAAALPDISPIAPDDGAMDLTPQPAEPPDTPPVPEPPFPPDEPSEPSLPDEPSAPDEPGFPAFDDDLASLGCMDAAGRDLLEAIGITTVTSLARSEIGEISEEIERANQTLRLASQTPGRAEIGRWIVTALARVGDNDDIPVLQPQPEQAPTRASAPPAAPEEPEPPVEDETPAGPLVNYEATEQVRELLSTAPLAIPLPARVLMHSGVTVADIAPAILLTEYAGDLDIRVGDRPPRLPRGSSAARTRAPAASYVQIANQTPPRHEVDASRFRKVGDAVPARRRISHSRATGGNPAEDRVALIRAPLAETNRGRDPRSRWYIRGVLHSKPWTMGLGAAVTLLLMALVPPALVASMLLLLSMLAPEQFHWVSPWLLLLPCSLPLPGLLYLILANKARCQICGQRQFFHRSCIKNSKAHHIPGLGYVASVALHMLVFRWFRCTYCGTPVRLKK